MTLTDFLLARVAEDEAAVDLDAPKFDYTYVLDSQMVPARVSRETARVLAECEAKRQIIALHDLDGADGECGVCRWASYPCDTLRLLALPYADHPEYRDEWRPA